MIRILCLCLACTVLSVSTSAATAVMSSIPPLASLVRLLDPSLKVQVLLPAHADPHHFSLRPRQATALRQSPLLLRTSAIDGQWQGLEQHSKAVLDLWPQQEHAWLHAEAVAKVLPRLTLALQKAYPSHQKQLQQGLQKALQQCALVQQAWQKLMQQPIPALVLTDTAWTSVFASLQPQVSLQSGHHGGLHPHALEAALALMRHYPQAWLLADVHHDQRTVAWLKSHSQQPYRFIQLDSLGHADDNWLQLMQRNMRVLQP